MSHQPDELQLFTRRLGYLDHLRRHAMDKIASECGLYAGQPPILFMLDHAGGQRTQNEIAQRLRVSAATIATSIKRMEKAGLLRKETHPTDQRRNLIVLTREGKEIVDKCRARFEEMDACMLSALDEGETEVFTRLLNQVITHMEVYTQHQNQTEEKRN